MDYSIGPAKFGNPNTVNKVNQLIRHLNEVFRLTGDGFIKVYRSSSGYSINLDIMQLLARIPKTAASSTGSIIHKAYMKADATAATTATCYLDTDATGDEVTVNFSITNGNNLDEAIPFLKDGTLIFITNIGGTWYCLQTLTGLDVCT